MQRNISAEGGQAKEDARDVAASRFAPFENVTDVKEQQEPIAQTMDNDIFADAPNDKAKAEPEDYEPTDPGEKNSNRTTWTWT